MGPGLAGHPAQVLGGRLPSRRLLAGGILRDRFPLPRGSSRRGSDNLATRASCHLAYTYRMAGSHPMNQLLPERERVLGLEHPETLITRQNLARWTEQAEHGYKEGMK